MQSPGSYEAEKIFWTVLSGQPTESELSLVTSHIVLSWWKLLFTEPPGFLTRVATIFVVLILRKTHYLTGFLSRGKDRSGSKLVLL